MPAGAAVITNSYYNYATVWYCIYTRTNITFILRHYATFMLQPNATFILQHYTTILLQPSTTFILQPHAIVILQTHTTFILHSSFAYLEQILHSCYFNTTFILHLWWVSIDTESHTTLILQRIYYNNTVFILKLCIQLLYYWSYYNYTNLW